MFALRNETVLQSKLDISEFYDFKNVGTYLKRTSFCYFSFGKFCHFLLTVININIMPTSGR